MKILSKLLELFKFIKLNLERENVKKLKRLIDRNFLSPLKTMSVPVNLIGVKPNIYYKDQEIQPLDLQEVRKRQKLYGKNIIEKHTARSWYVILLHSIFDPFGLLLMGNQILYFNIYNFKKK